MDKEPVGLAQNQRLWIITSVILFLAKKLPESSSYQYVWLYVVLRWLYTSKNTNYPLVAKVQYRDYAPDDMHPGFSNAPKTS